MNTVPGPFAALQLARLRQAAEGVQDGALERDQLRAEATALQEEVSDCFLLLLSVVPVVSSARRTATLWLRYTRDTTPNFPFLSL